MVGFGGWSSGRRESDDEMCRCGCGVVKGELSGGVLSGWVGFGLVMVVVVDRGDGSGLGGGGGRY